MNWSDSWQKSPVIDDKYKEKGFEGTWANSPTPSIQVETSPSANPWDSMNEDQLLMEHRKLQNDLATLKAKELDLRKYIVNRAFPQKEEGTNTKELGNGYELKAVIKYNYKLADNDTVDKTLQEIAATGNQGSFIADRLVSWKPSFLLTEYRNLQEEADKGSDEAKKILKICDKMLTIEDAAPTLSIKEPKVKK